jgi:hypothetical protein
MEGTVTNTRKRKFNTHETSVTAEQEVQELILSPKSCRKCESIHFDDDAYILKIHTLLLAMNHTILSSTLQKKKGEFNIIMEDREDCIPLGSIDNVDLEDEEIDNFSECSDNFFQGYCFKESEYAKGKELSRAKHQYEYEKMEEIAQQRSLFRSCCSTNPFYGMTE